MALLLSELVCSGFTLQGLVPHLQCWRYRVEARQAELLTAPHSSMLNLVAPVSGLIHRLHCDSPGEWLQLQNEDKQRVKHLGFQFAKMSIKD